MDLQKILGPDMINSYLIPWNPRIIMALVIFLIGRRVAQVLVRLIRRMMKKAHAGKLGGVLERVL